MEFLNRKKASLHLRLSYKTIYEELDLFNLSLRIISQEYISPVVKTYK